MPNKNESDDRKIPKYGPQRFQAPKGPPSKSPKDPRRARLLSLARQKKWPEPTEDQLREVLEATKHYDRPEVRPTFDYFIGTCYKYFDRFPTGQECREFEASIQSYEEYCQKHQIDPKNIEQFCNSFKKLSR